MSDFEDLLVWHEHVESWCYTGPLAEGIYLSLTDYPIVSMYTREDGRRVVESGIAFGVGDTQEEAWRYYLGADFGPVDEEFRGDLLWAALEEIAGNSKEVGA